MPNHELYYRRSKKLERKEEHHAGIFLERSNQFRDGSDSGGKCRSATESKTVTFHYLHKKCHTRPNRYSIVPNNRVF